jgi:thymidine phosphorylase
MMRAPALIASSIFSKKLAAGVEFLLVDVKYGDASLAGDRESARQLGQLMVELGAELDLPTAAVLTPMEAMIGSRAGRWLEVIEAVECLRDENARGRDSVIELSARLVSIARASDDVSSARGEVEEVLQSGRALEKWEQMIEAQGADLDAYRAQLAEESLAPETLECRSQEDGVFPGFSPRVLGATVSVLTLDAADSRHAAHVGVDRVAAAGTSVKAGEVVARVHAVSTGSAARASEALSHDLLIQRERPPWHAREMEYLPPMARSSPGI